MWYTLDRPPKGWAFSTGFISEDMIAERLPGPQVRVGLGLGLGSGLGLGIGLGLGLATPSPSP